MSLSYRLLIAIPLALVLLAAAAALYFVFGIVIGALSMGGCGNGFLTIWIEMLALPLAAAALAPPVVFAVNGKWPRALLALVIGVVVSAGWFVFWWIMSGALC